MHIKQIALKQELQRSIAPLYLLIGQDSYLLNKAFKEIQTAIKQQHDVDQKALTLESSDDWQRLVEEANSYSLFAEYVLITLVYGKKTMTAEEKKIISDYLNQVNPRCFIIIEAPLMTQKSIQSLASHKEMLLVITEPFNKPDMKKWIVTELKCKGFIFEPSVPDLIHQYTEGNMLACAQLIDKIALSFDAKSLLLASNVLAEVTNQCDFSPFELIETCLLAKADKALQIIRHAANNKTETTFILWILATELRTLLQLMAAEEKKKDRKATYQSLKIWPQRIRLYDACLKRHKQKDLSKLLQYCQLIDERIKSNAGNVWDALESLALGLCLGQFIGETQGFCL